MTNMLRFACYVAMACCAPIVLAQEFPSSRQLGGGTRTISGSVVLRGAMVSNVRVTIQSASRSFVRTVYADGSGSFGIGGVPVGNYTIELEAEGYLTHRESIDVPPGSGALVLQFMMRPALSARPPSSKEPLVSAASLQVPQDARREFAAGQRDVEHERWNEAKRHFEKALRKHPDFPQALRGLALIDVLEQQPERAVDRLRRAVQIDASFAEGYWSLSHVLNGVGRHAESLESAQKAVSLRPELWQAQYELGVAALALGRDDLAIEACYKIQSMAGPTVPEGMLLRAGVWLRERQYAKAKEELEAFLRLAPRHWLAPLAKETLEKVVNEIKVAESR